MIGRPKKQAAAYLRRSTNGTSQERSLDTQRAELVEFAERNGYQIEEQHWYSDDALSGGRDDRPGFQSLMKAADRGEFEVIVCYESGRLSRQDPQDLAPYWARLNAAGVELHSVVEGVIETKTFEGFLMAIVRQKGKADYLEQVAASVSRGLRAVRLAGKWTAPTPTGYRKDENSFLHVDPEGAEIIRRIFEFRAAGRGYKWIGRELGEMGVKPRQGATAWSANSVRHLIHNKLYLTGHCDVSRHSRAKHHRLSEEPVSVKVAEPIISQDLWDRAHAFDGKRQKGRFKGDSYGAELSGLCYCGTCGGAMYVAGQYGTRRLRCGRNINRGDCPNGSSVEHDKLLAAVLGTLKDHLFSVPEDRLRRLAAEVLAETPQDDGRKRLQAQLDKLQQKIARALDAMLEAGTHLHKDIQQKLDRMATEREALQGKLHAIPQRTDKLTIDEVLGHLRRLQEVLPNSRADKTREALGHVIDGITIEMEVAGGSERRKYYRVKRITMRLGNTCLPLVRLLRIGATVELAGELLAI